MAIQRIKVLDVPVDICEAQDIEEKILELQETKQDLADAILEGRSESLMSLSSEELLALLN